MPPQITVGRRTTPLPYKTVEEIVTIKVPVFEEYVVEKPIYVYKEFEVPNIQYVEKIVEVPVERIVYKDVIVERPVFKDVIVDRVSYNDVLIQRPVYEDKIVPVPKETIKEEVKVVMKEHFIDADRIQFVDRLVEVPVFKGVPVKALCSRCGKVET